VGRAVRRGLEHVRRAAAAYAVLAVALLLTALATEYVRENVAARETARFGQEVASRHAAIDRRINAYIDAMLGARALFDASQEVSEDEWRAYVSSVDIESRYEGIQALAFVRREPDGTFPVTYVQPETEVNDGSLGEDASLAGATDREAMEGARDSGEPRATDKVFVRSEPVPNSGADYALKPGFRVYLPLYRGDEAISGSVEERREALRGYVVGHFRSDELLRGIFGVTPERTVDFELYDSEEMLGEHLLFDSDGEVRAEGDPDALHGTRGLFVAGREWTLYFEALPGFYEEGQGDLSLLVGASGVAISFLFFGITYALVRNRLRVEGAGKRLEETNRELEATNRELEAFSYSVSHDLRAPLRSIDGFSQILLEDYWDDLDDEGRDYLRRVRGASQKMGRLIDDLLGLSRVTRGVLRRERVDLGAIAREVFAELREEAPERRVEFHADEGLVELGDARLVRVALWNLIGNAWKFTAKEPVTRIEFGRDAQLSREGGVPVYAVRDNGAGFEMAYANKLFGAFQRLHASDEFEGTGIGLATVQRIVHRHGGRIWARGAVGEGAAFFFTLRPGLRFDPEARNEEETAADGAEGAGQREAATR
jgi:signal transduction histidine kinase